MSAGWSASACRGPRAVALAARLRGSVIGVALLAALAVGVPAQARDSAAPAAPAAVRNAAAPACTRATGPVGIEPARMRARDVAELQRPGRARLRFEARDGNELTVYAFRPASFDPAKSPIWFVMHGRGRDARRYAEEARPQAEQYGALLLAIEFPREDYPSGDRYTLGVVSRGKPDASALREGRWRDPADYLYNEVERVFEAVRTATGSRQGGYYLFGHSAGAQFTHRLLTFVPCARVLRAVAANAGWYTLPGRDEPHPMPYSLRETPLGVAEQRALLAAPLVVLLGTSDTREADEDDGVRGTEAALAQGPNRLARGRHYFEAGRRLAQQLRVPFNWRLVLAPGAGHDAGQVIAPAARALFASQDAANCVPADSRQPSSCTPRRSP